MTDPTDRTAHYPPRWEADVVLADGGTAHLRPIRPDDDERLVAHFARLSPETVYRRFFMARNELTPAEVTRFTNVDHVDRVALVAMLGGDLVAVGRYDRLPGTDEAEVAFVVEDAHQGRGLGSVLLEHLAAAARERGVRRFLAEVLPGNRRMVGVFTDAGYEARREYGDGVVTLTFPIQPTELSQSVMQSREHRAEARSIERLLSPRSVAVIGASRREHSIGQSLLRNLRDYGFTGDVYAVNPAGGDVAGLPTYASVLDIEGDVDLAVVATPASEVPAVVDACARKRVRGLVVVSSGFAETGADGLAMQRRLVAIARTGGMRVIGPNCLGVINTDPEVRLNATLSPVAPPHGRVGFFCHAGALGIAILEAAERRGLGLSTFVSAGNRADVSGNDLLQFWEDDDASDVVLLYLESFGNPRKFGRLARRVARRKPVVAVKGARSVAGPPAWLAGSGVRSPEPAVDALFRQAGVIRVDTLAQMFDVAVLLAHQPLPAGRRVGVVGNSAALGLIAADAAVASGLEVVTSVDIGLSGSAEDFRTALVTALERPDVDAVVTVFIPPLYTPDAEVADVLVEVALDAAKPVVTTFYGFDRVTARLRAAGAADGGRAVPTYRSPEAAVLALASAVGYAEWRARPVGTVPDTNGTAATELTATRAAASAVVGRGLADPSLDGWLATDDAAALLGAYGIDVWPSATASSADDAVAAAGRVGYPVAVKATAEHLRHRTDIGGVRLDLGHPDDVRAAYQAIQALGDDTVVVQPMAPAGVGTVIGVTEDPSFGSLVSFGLAGVATELLGDTGYRSLPLTDVDAAELVRSVRAAPMLFGHRGARPVDVAALEDLLLRLGRLADDVPAVVAVDLNPVLVAESGLTVLSAAVRVAPPADDPELRPRRLG